MTGKEILGAEFEKAGMRGYKAEQVDSLLKDIATYVDEQEAEKNDLLYKIKILAGKIEEYKADESNLRDALLGAQKLGTSMLNEAKAKAEAITREAKSYHDDMMGQAKAKIELYTKDSIQKANAELSRIKKDCETQSIVFEKTKKEVSNFKSAIFKQYKIHLDLLSNLPSVSQEIKSDESLNNSIEDIKPTLFDQDIAEDKFEPAQEELGHDAQTITSSILTNEKELENDVFGQTKEFGHSKDINNDRNENESVNENVREKSETQSHQRPNYMEKFGELKFGGFGKTDK